MTTNVNTLSNEAWSSQKDQIYLKDATPYEIKCYHNRYFLAWEKCVKPVLTDFWFTWDINNKNQALSEEFRVLDSATGTGAGAAYIAERFKYYGDLKGLGICHSVVGVDLSEESIKYASERYNPDGTTLRFTCIDMLRSVEIPNNWNVIISMETLEHIPYETMRKFLAGCSTALKPGGKAIFSCPRLRPRESTVKRPGHINELSYQDFKYTLGEYFQFLEFYSFDRYGNVVPDYPDCNLQVAICSKPPATKIF